MNRVLAQAGLPRTGPPPQPSQIDPFLPFINQTLEKFPYHYLHADGTLKESGRRLLEKAAK